MTAYEVADRREEKLRMMSPTLGRVVTELHGPMIKRTYLLLNQHGKLPPAPEILRGKTMKIGYQSPASRAQTGVKAMSMGRFIQEITPLAQINPEILDVVDLDTTVQEIALARGTPRKIIRTPEQIAEIRAARQQQQAMQQMAEIAEPATKAIKNLAEANAAGGML
jgi:hypothetical protein